MIERTRLKRRNVEEGVTVSSQIPSSLLGGSSALPSQVACDSSGLRFAVAYRSTDASNNNRVKILNYNVSTKEWTSSQELTFSNTYTTPYLEFSSDGTVLYIGYYYAVSGTAVSAGFNAIYRINEAGTYVSAYNITGLYTKNHSMSRDGLVLFLTTDTSANSTVQICRGYRATSSTTAYVARGTVTPGGDNDFLQGDSIGSRMLVFPNTAGQAALYNHNTAFTASSFRGDAVETNGRAAGMSASDDLTTNAFKLTNTTVRARMYINGILNVPITQDIGLPVGVTGTNYNISLDTNTGNTLLVSVYAGGSTYQYMKYLIYKRESNNFVFKKVIHLDIPRTSSTGIMNSKISRDGNVLMFFDKDATSTKVIVVRLSDIL